MLAIKMELLSIRGGEAGIDVERRLLIERIAFKTVNQRMREAAAMRVATQDALPPELGKDHFTCAESLRRDLMALQVLDDRHAKRLRDRAGDWTQEPDAPLETDEPQAAH